MSMHEIPFRLLRRERTLVIIAATLPRPTIEPVGKITPMPIQSTSAETLDPLELTMIRPEQLLEARYVSPSQMFLRFADGLEGTWTFDELDIDMSNMNVATIKASSGTSVGVQSKRGENVQLD